MTTAYYIERRHAEWPHGLGTSFLPQGLIFDRRREEIREEIYARLLHHPKTRLRHLLSLLLAVVLGIAFGVLAIFLLRQIKLSNTLTTSATASLQAEYIWMSFHRVMPVYPVLGFPFAYVPFIFLS